MKHLYKKISLEPYISRQCGIIPSYESGYDTIVSFDPTTSMTSNYGMIPMSLSFKNECLSYSELMLRYHFCKDYIKLLTTNHQCKNIKYNSAIDYYNHEIQYKTIYLENEYHEMDTKFNNYGGYEFVSFCEETCFPTFVFNVQFEGKDYIINAWNIERMSFIDIKKWIKKLNDLKNSEIPCDNCKYEELYGDEVITTMNMWLNKLSSVSFCEETCIDIPILFTTSIENLGEFTIFSKDWNAGENYGSKGATVIFNDELYEFNPKGDDFGSLYSTKYKENYFPNTDAIEGTWMEEWLDNSGNKLKYNKNQWDKKNVYVLDIIPELKTFLLKNEKDKILEYLDKLKCDFYSFKDGLKILLPKDKTKYKDVMSYQYNIDTNNNLGFFFIKGNLYRVFKNEYINYNNEVCLVNNFEPSNIGIKYCTINGVKYYSYYEDNLHKININGNVIILNGNIGSFIFLNNTPILIEDDKIKLYDKLNKCYVIYNKFDGITEVDGNIIYIYGDKSVKFNRTENDDNIEYVNDDTILTYVGWRYNSASYNKEKLYEISGNTLYFHKPYIIYDKTKTTGYTETKLSLLIDDVVAYDDMGNKLPCSLNKDNDGNYKHPSHNELMDINFHVGNTSQLSFLFDEKYFGNIITDIFYYYNDSFGNKVCTSTTINGAINLKENFNADYNRNGFVINKLRCDITYYIGAILNKTTNNKYTYSNGGVKYIDSITLEESICSYYKDEFDSIMLKYYNFIYDSKYVINNEYNNSKNSINMAYFEINKEKNSGINDNIIDNIIEKVKEDIKNLFTIKIPLDELIDDQIFREECKLGIATKEKIDSNVYIDRGIASAFEKHIKMLDVNSLESMEQVGNGYFNIKKN